MVNNIETTKLTTANTPEMTLMSSLGLYLSAFTLLDLDLLAFKPSLIATGVLVLTKNLMESYLARKLSFADDIQKLASTGFNAPEVKEVINRLLHLVKHGEGTNVKRYFFPQVVRVLESAAASYVPIA